jgi:hypothetical protein
MSWVTNLVKIPRHAIGNCPTARFHVWLVHKEMFAKNAAVSVAICQDTLCSSANNWRMYMWYFACLQHNFSITCKQFDAEDIPNEIC